MEKELIITINVIDVENITKFNFVGNEFFNKHELVGLLETAKYLLLNKEKPIKKNVRKKRGI